MTRVRPRILLLGLVLASLACGTNKKGLVDGSSRNDGGSDDLANCGGKPSIGCVAGFPSDAGGVWCGDFLMPATCRDDQWSCPSGMVFETDCTCGAPGISCSPQICTAAGPVCLDAGTAPDAGRDAPTDGASCGDSGPNPYCAEALTMPNLGPLVCGDYLEAATCVGGRWKCDETGTFGWVFAGACNCSGAFPGQSCNVCTTHGWDCSDGGVDGSSGG